MPEIAATELPPGENSRDAMPAMSFLDLRADVVDRELARREAGVAT